MANRQHRRASAGLLSAAAAFVIVALVSASALAAPVTLRWRTCCRQEDRVELFQRWAEEFEAENPDIRIEWYDPPGGLTQVKVEIAGGAEPSGDYRVAANVPATIVIGDERISVDSLSGAGMHEAHPVE